MRVIRLWLALFGLITVARAGSAPAADTVVLHIATDLVTPNRTVVDQIIVLASARAAVHSLARVPADRCAAKSLAALSKDRAAILITDDVSCASAKIPNNALVFLLDITTQTVKMPPNSIPFSSLSLLDPSIASLIAQVARQKSDGDGDKKSCSVPVWFIIVLCIVCFFLLCICYMLYNKLQKINKKADASKKASAKSRSEKRSKSSSRRTKSKRGSSSRSSKSSRRSGKSKRARRSSHSSFKVISAERLALPNDTATPLYSVKVVPLFPAAVNDPSTPKRDEIAEVIKRKSLDVRDLSKRIELPMTEEEFIMAMKSVMEFITEYYRNPGKYKVATSYPPTYLFNAIDKNPPEDPESFADVWKTFNKLIVPGFINWQHPQFHAFFPCGRSYPDILAETVISSLGTVGFSWAANPAITELETAMVNWMGRALGIPERFLFSGPTPTESPGGGWIADTASDAIFCAVMAARHNAVQREIYNRQVKSEELSEGSKHISKKYDEKASIIAKLVAYGSYESHSSFEKACMMAFVRCRPIKVYEKDKFGMRLEHLEKNIIKDIARGLIPFYVHIALGTTSTATSDHIKEIVRIKEKYNVWVHVDAAYAGSAWVEPKYRHNEGIEKVDSININLHKFFLTSTSATLFWTSRQSEYKKGFAINPAYLKKNAGVNDLRDWGVPLSRRFKALKVYMLLRIYGLKGMRAYVNRICDMTAYMEQQLIKIPFIKRYGDVNYGLFCVQYVEPGVDVNKATKRLYDELNGSHRIVFTHSKIDHHHKFPKHDDIIRVAVTLERSTTKDVDESVAIFKEILADFQKKKNADPHYLNLDMPSILEQDPGIVGSPNALTTTYTPSRTPIPRDQSVENLLKPVEHSSTAVAKPSTGAAAPALLATASDCATVEMAKPAAAAAPAAAQAAAAPTAVAVKPQPAAQKMPPLTPAFDTTDSSSKKSTSSYNAPPTSAPPTAVQPPPVAAAAAAAPIATSVTQASGRSEATATQTEKKT